MIKQAPKLWQLLLMVAFVLSCFGVLLYLWLSFGGTSPLAAKGYRFHVYFPEATQLAQQADVRISGVPVGQGGQDRSRHQERHRHDDRAAEPLCARAPRRSGDAADEDPAGRDVRRPLAGRPLQGTLPEGEALPRGGGRRDGRARRDLPQLRRADAQGVPDLDAVLLRRRGGTRGGHQRHARQPARAGGERRGDPAPAQRAVGCGQQDDFLDRATSSTRSASARGSCARS